MGCGASTPPVAEDWEGDRRSLLEQVFKELDDNGSGGMDLKELLQIAGDHASAKACVQQARGRCQL